MELFPIRSLGDDSLYTQDSEDRLRQKFQQIFPFLDEKLRRLVAGSEAITLGYGGIVMVARASGLSEPTVRAGMREIGEPDVVPLDRIRRPGGAGSRGCCATQRLLRGSISRVVRERRADCECMRVKNAEKNRQCQWASLVCPPRRQRLLRRRVIPFVGMVEKTSLAGDHCGKAGIIAADLRVGGRLGEMAGGHQLLHLRFVTRL